MEAFFTGIPWNITGWGAFILLAFVNLRALIRGDMIPESRHQEVKDDRDVYRKLFFDLRNNYDEREKTAWSATTAQGATMVAMLESIWTHARGKEARDAQADPRPAHPGE